MVDHNSEIPMVVLAKDEIIREMILPGDPYPLNEQPAEKGIKKTYFG